VEDGCDRQTGTLLYRCLSPPGGSGSGSGVGEFIGIINLKAIIWEGWKVHICKYIYI
jgi:hypothetical protein